MQTHIMVSHRRGARAAMVGVVGLLVSSFAATGVSEEPMPSGEIRTMAEVCITNVLLQQYWKHLETNKDFRPIVDRLAKEFENDAYKWRAIRSAKNDPKKKYQPQGQFEKKLLRRFEKQPDDAARGRDKAPSYEERFDRRQREYHYFRPIYATRESCILCHKAMWKNDKIGEGDLLSIIRITLPVERSTGR